MFNFQISDYFIITLKGLNIKLHLTCYLNKRMNMKLLYMIDYFNGNEKSVKQIIFKSHKINIHIQDKVQKKICYIRILAFCYF